MAFFVARNSIRLFQDCLQFSRSILCIFRARHSTYGFVFDFSRPVLHLLDFDFGFGHASTCHELLLRFLQDSPTVTLLLFSLEASMTRPLAPGM